MELTAMKASDLERDVERNLAGPLDRRDDAHSSSDFEPARIRHGSAICAESIARPLVPVASKEVACDRLKQGELRGALEARLVGFTPWEQM
jgi:hypothetical protein